MFRLGNKAKLPVEFEFGMLIAAQFGGSKYQKLPNGESQLILNMPNDLDAYWKAFLPAAGGSDTPITEQANIEGNMLGSWNFALNYYWKDWKLRVTLDHYFEDHSQMFWEYGRWKDGQLSIELTFPKINGFPLFSGKELVQKIHQDQSYMMPIGDLSLIDK